VFSKNVLLKINESILGKLLFVLIIILFSHENTTYGLFIAILFFIVNEKFTYSYYENMSCNNKKNEKDSFSNFSKEDLTKEYVQKVKPTSSTVVELSEQLKSLTLNPRKKPNSIKTQTYIADPDIINLMDIKTSAFNTLYDNTQDIDYTNFYN